MENYINEFHKPKKKKKTNSNNPILETQEPRQKSKWGPTYDILSRGLIPKTKDKSQRLATTKNKTKPLALTHLIIIWKEALVLQGSPWYPVMYIFIFALEKASVLSYIKTETGK